MVRRFNRTARRALWFASKGRCANCGVELVAGWHADHVIPWAKGGPTHVTNGQSLCAECNLRKGSTMMNLQPWPIDLDLRPWQRRDATALLGGDVRRWTQHACPASGKTVFANYVAHSLLTDKRVDMVLIVVPTENLRNQWVSEAHSMGIQLDPEISGHRPNPGSEYHGGVMTFQTLAQPGAAQNWATYLSAHQGLLIVDECHHAIESAIWGDALNTVGDQAKYQVNLTGTPFHTKKSARLAGVDFDENDVIICNGRYTYSNAIDDHACREMQFVVYDGQVTVLDRSETREMKLAVDLDGNGLDDAESSAALRAALTVGDFLPSMLEHSAVLLDGLREVNPNAGALVVAMTKREADRIASILRHMGRDVVVVHGDEENSADKIKHFRTGRTPWLVAVGMVSEGTDIPRLALLVYATNKSTPMIFRQMCGRVMRTWPKDPTPVGLCVLPNNPTLVKLGRDLLTEMYHQVKEPSEGPQPPQTEPRFENINSGTSQFDEAFNTDGARADARIYALGEDFCARTGLPAHMAMAVGLELDRLGHSRPQPQTPDAPPPPDDGPLFHQKSRLKAQVDGLIRTIVSDMIRKDGLDFKTSYAKVARQVYTDVASTVGAWRNEDITLEQYQRQVAYLTERLAAGRGR